MKFAFCDSCQASLRNGAKYCGNCGALTPTGMRETRDRQRDGRREMAARGAAVGIVFVGSLVGMLAVVFGVDAEVEVRYGLVCIAYVAVGLLALHRLGKGALRYSFGRAPDAISILYGTIVPIATVLIALGYVAMLPGDAPPPSDVPIVTALLLSAVMPALFEEWLCRGVLWVALRPITTSGITIFSTAALFAFLHGLNGGFIFELPHRFAMGLLAGLLRAKTGSLWPCVLAHFLHNGFCVVALDG